MKVYLDLIFILNFSFDFLLLLTVSIVLKRHVKFYKLLLGALIGGLSIFLLFIKINSLELFILKLLISILMIIVTFKFKDIKYTLINLGYLYLVSIILGGFLYLLNVQFSYKQEGLVFYHNGLSINFIILIILSPIILYIYVRQAKELKVNYNNYYNVKIYYKNNIYNLTGFVDTGNKLKSLYSNKNIIIINKNIIKDINDFILIPINTINKSNMLRCFKIDKVEINDLSTTNVLIGISDERINIDGVDCILNSYIMEEIK